MALDPYKGKIKCLRCGYPLLGLPPVHSCPECGLDYDPYSRFVPLRSRPTTVSLLLYAGASGCLLAIAFLLLHGAGAATFLLLVPALCCSSSLYAHSRGSPSTLVIDRAGIRFTYPDRDDVLIPWSRFGAARVSRATGRVQIHDRSGCRIQGRYYIPSFWLTHACVERMNELARVYAEARIPAKHPDSTTSPTTDDRKRGD